MEVFCVRIVWLVLALISIWTPAFSSERKFPLVFVLYDAGETLALEPVMDELGKVGVSYKALVMGTASQVMKDRGDTLDINKDCNVSAIIDQQSWPRERELSANDMEKVKECFDARVVVVGMVSRVQHQIALLQNQRAREVIAFYDGLAPLEPKSIGQSFLTVATRVLVPSLGIKKQIKEKSPALDVVAVGQPTLEKWALAKEQKDPASIYSKMPFLNRDRKTVLYAGGYGDTYERAFTLFAQAAKRLSRYNILLSLHPKVDGSLEKSVLEKVAANNVVIIPRSISTMDAAIVSDIVASQRSTVGVQALFMGKPVLYLDVPGASFKDVAISMGWAKQLFDVNSFERAVESELKRKASRAFDIYGKAQIPRHSAKLITNLLQAELKP